MVTSKSDIVSAVGRLSTNFNALNDLLPYPCGNASDFETYALNIKAEIATLAILAANYEFSPKAIKCHIRILKQISLKLSMMLFTAS